MRWILILLFCVCLAGCKSAPIHPKSVGPDTYQVVRRTEFGPAITQKQAYEAAQAHAAQENKRVVALSENMSLEEDFRAKYDYHTFELTYRLVDPNDPVLQEIAQESTQTSSIPAPITDSDDLYTKIMKLQALKDDGLLTEEEFLRVKEDLMKKK
ncbi:SHOCT domain-containing protein [Planctomycetota bacterium]